MGVQEAASGDKRKRDLIGSSSGFNLEIAGVFHPAHLLVSLCRSRVGRKIQ